MCAATLIAGNGDGDVARRIGDLCEWFSAFASTSAGRPRESRRSESRLSLIWHLSSPLRRYITTSPLMCNCKRALPATYLYIPTLSRGQLR